VVNGHAMKGKQQEQKLEALEDPTMLIDIEWQIMPQPWSYTLCLHYVRWYHIIGSGHFLRMKPIEKIISFNL
jgi:hypothetical protein